MDFIDFYKSEGQKRIVIKAFVVDDISEVKSVLDVSGVKHLFSEDVNFIIMDKKLSSRRSRIIAR